MPMDPGCVFCANFQLVFGKHSNKGRSWGEQNQDLGFIKKAMTSKNQSELVWSGSVWI